MSDDKQYKRRILHIDTGSLENLNPLQLGYGDNEGLSYFISEYNWGGKDSLSDINRFARMSTTVSFNNVYSPYDSAPVTIVPLSGAGYVDTATNDRGMRTVNIGLRAGAHKDIGWNGVNIGQDAGDYGKDSNCVNIGRYTASYNNMNRATNIGHNAAISANNYPGYVVSDSVSIGYATNAYSNTTDTIAIGDKAGLGAYTHSSVLIGRRAGHEGLTGVQYPTEGIYSTIIGHDSGIGSIIDRSTIIGYNSFNNIRGKAGIIISPSLAASTAS